MKLCDDGHDEVAYTDRKCPCCELLGDIKDKDNKIDILETRIGELEDDLDEARGNE